MYFLENPVSIFSLDAAGLEARVYLTKKKYETETIYILSVDILKLARIEQTESNFLIFHWIIGWRHTYSVECGEFW